MLNITMMLLLFEIVMKFGWRCSDELNL